MTISDREKAIRQKLKDNFPHFASKCLKIRTKEGQILPFTLNRAQQYIHAKLEEQKALTGKVRALILKGRQQGCSTYVGARYYHQVIHRFGTQAFILTHALDATNNLYKMAQRYYENTPSLIKPEVTTSNAKELIFGKLDSGYKLGTAENQSVGRSATIQLLHGSEVAFWNHASEHAKGIFQAVPNATGTEIVLESTANGVGNFFHQQWQKAEAGESEYIAIFVPWFWQEEYQTNVPDNFALTVDEEELMRQYNLTIKQIAWRRNKITEFSVNGTDGVKSFMQEYPCIVGGERVGTNIGLIPIEQTYENLQTNTGIIKKTWCSGNKNTIQINTSLGYTLKCTLDHRIATASHFVEAKDSLNNFIKLSIPNFCEKLHILTWNPMPTITSSIIINEDWGLFLGYFMGDGSYSDCTLSFAFNNKDTDCIEIIKKLVKKLFDLDLYERVTSTNGIELRVSCITLRPIFKALGILTFNSKGNFKRKVNVPEVIWRSPKFVIKQFLKGLFEADGFANNKNASIKFFSKYETFVKDVQLLLLGFGITSRRIHVEKKSGDKIHTYMGNELSLRNAEAKLFKNEIGFLGQRKIAKCDNWIYSEHNKGKKLKLEDEVISITPLGFNIVYDIEMQTEPHVFDVQGILVHNCNSSEAFQLTGEDSYVPNELVLRARKTIQVDDYGHLVVGVDPARFGADRSAIIRRKGRKAFGLETYVKKDTMEIVGIVNNIIMREQPAKVFVDIGGLGAGIVDRLKELGHGNVVIGINAGSTPLDSRKYSNKRSEMWGELKSWLEDEPCQIPDSDELHSDICGTRYKIDSNSRLMMEKKEEMKKRGIRSSDTADALCLTFSLPINQIANSSKTSQTAGKIMGKQRTLLTAKGQLYGNSS